MKAIAVRRDELVEEEGEQEIRRRAAGQAEKWLVKLRGDLEEKTKEKEGMGNWKGLEGVRGTDFKDEGRVGR